MKTPAQIAHYLIKPVNRAVREFDLIGDSDRVAVGVSGGKDSRTLLELLVRGVDIPGSYRVVAVHVDGSRVGLPDQRPHLEPWFRDLGVAYAIVPLEVPSDEALPMDCYRCAWNRRKSLFLAANRLGCNKVAFGHHADDAAITTILSILYKGQVESLEPRRDFFDGRITVVRPMIYLAEVEIRRYARAAGWIFPPELACPHGKSSRRLLVEHFLSALSLKERVQARANLWRLAREMQQGER